MRKFVVCLCMSLALLATCRSVFAAEVRPYVGMFIGPMFISDTKDTASVFTGAVSNAPGGFTTDVTFKPGIAIGGSTGLDFSYGGVEVEVAYRSNDIDKVAGGGADGNLQVISYMLNGLLSFPVMPNLKPFIMGGIGIATADRSRLTPSGFVFDAVDSTRFAYQSGVGVEYDLTRHITLNFGFRFLAANFDFNGNKFKYGSHGALFGARYNF